MKKILLGLFLLFGLAFGISVAQANLAGNNNDGHTWRTAPRHSAGIARDPAAWADTAIVQIYVASTFGWRGYFAVHPWLIYKRAGETAFTRVEVSAWGGGDVIKRNGALPDGLWFGAQPKLLVDRRGEHVEAMIDGIEKAVASYPYPRTYRTYPGPNSNTFIAHIGREVPALGLDLPANAIGKDFRPLTAALGVSATGRGIQASLLGLLGISVGLEEGIEINLLGLDFGVDLNRPALRLPFIGRLGMSDQVEDIRIAK